MVLLLRLSAEGAAAVVSAIAAIVDRAVARCPPPDGFFAGDGCGVGVVGRPRYAPSSGGEDEDEDEDDNEDDEAGGGNGALNDEVGYRTRRVLPLAPAAEGAEPPLMLPSLPLRDAASSLPGSSSPFFRATSSSSSSSSSSS
jgi:hypothetical protein